MSLSIEQEAQKSAKRAKTAKIIAVCAAVLFVAWSIFMIVQNPNKAETRLVDTLVEATADSEQPDALKLIRCTDFVEYKSPEGKKRSYVVAEMEQAGVKNTYVLITRGKKYKGERIRGKMYTPETISEMDYADRDKIVFKVDKEMENVNIDKVNKIFIRYLKFKDRI